MKEVNPMAVIVHANENIDSALKRLHREVMREKILETYREKAYRSKKADLAIQKRREWAKMKRRRRTAARRAR
ncbi:MAG: 30S ribosomal protein S21 [Candidatus Dojkabacteria bacterium]